MNFTRLVTIRSEIESHGTRVKDLNSTWPVLLGPSVVFIKTQENPADAS
jgi:hypothetical protein